MCPLWHDLLACMCWRLKRLPMRRDLSLANCSNICDSALESLGHTIQRLQHAALTGDHAVPAPDADDGAARLASRIATLRVFVEVHAPCKAPQSGPSRGTLM